MKATIDYYMENATYMRGALKGFGLTVYGGENSPYIWLQTPKGIGSWEFFDKLLHEAQIVTTPGAGFGAAGEGYIRITAFGSHEASHEAMERIGKIL